MVFFDLWWDLPRLWAELVIHTHNYCGSVQVTQEIDGDGREVCWVAVVDISSFLIELTDSILIGVNNGETVIDVTFRKQSFIIIVGPYEIIFYVVHKGFCQ